MAIFALITIFGNVHRPYKQYPKIVNNTVYYFSSFFLIFSYICINYYIWKCAQTVNTTHNIVKNSLNHDHSLFLFFSDFLAISTLLTIFGNVHRPCKQYPSTVNSSLHCVFFLKNSPWFSGYVCITYHIWKCAKTMWTVPQHVNNSPHQVYSFFLFFFFSLIFWLYLHWLPYLEMCTDHINSSATSPYHHHFLPDCFAIFSSENTKLAIFGNF